MLEPIIEEDELSKISYLKSQTTTLNTYDGTIDGVVFSAHFGSFDNSSLNRRFVYPHKQNKKTQTPASFLNSVSPSSWDRQYYYGSSRPISNPNFGNWNETVTMKYHRCVCGNSIRLIILVLSFLVIGSLFANLLLFNLVAIISQIASKGNVSFLEELGSANVSPIVAFYDNLFSVPFNCSSEYIDSTIALAENPARTLDAAVEEENQTEIVDFDGITKNTSYGNQSLEGITVPINKPTKETTECLMVFFYRQIAFVSPAIAILLSYIPCTILMRRFKAYFIITASLGISGILTASFPFVFQLGLGYWYIFALRFIVGLVSGPAFCLTPILIENWATLKEQLAFFLVCFLGFEFGPLMSTLPVTYFNIRKVGIIMIFILHASISCILMITWILFYRDTPQEHRLVYGLESNQIVTGKSKRNRLLEEQNEKFSYFISYATACGTILITIVHFVIVPAFYNIMDFNCWIYAFTGALIFLLICSILFTLISFLLDVRGYSDEFTLIDDDSPRQQHGVPLNVLLLNTRNLGHDSP